MDKQKDSFALRQYIAMVMEAEKAQTETAQNWVQVKSLMRFVKQQQAESDRRCGLLQTHTCVHTHTHSGETVGPVPHTHTMERRLVWHMHTALLHSLL